MTPEQLQAQRDRATRPRRTVPIVLNGDLRERIETLYVELDQVHDQEQAKQADRRLASPGKTPPARVAEIEAELDAAYSRAEQETLFVVVEGLQGTPWRALVAEHTVPEGDETRKPWGPLGVDRYGMETPLIRACLIGHRATADAEAVDPLDDDTLDWLLDFCTVEQQETLFLAAWAVCRGDDAVPLRRTRSTTQTSDSA